MRRHFEIIKDYQDIIDATHLPRRGTSESAGYDFKSAVDIEIPSLLSEYLAFALGTKEDKCTDSKDLDELKAWMKAHTKLKPTLIPTGIKAIMPSDEYLSLDNRSSVPLNSFLMVANSRGIIDADYQYADNDGHIHVMVYNMSPFPIKIHKGDKIAQGIFHKYEVTTDDDPIKHQRTGGFGHTGRK